MIYQFIKEHQHEYRVYKMCQALGVSTSGYYNWHKRTLSEPKKARKELTEALPVRVNRTVQRIIMTEEGLKSITERRFKATTNSKHDQPTYPNLLEQNY